MTSPQPQDEALLQAYLAGDIKAFETLAGRYRTPIYNFILRSVRNPDTASELLQEVFLRVVQRAPTFRGNAKLSTWMYTIARNLCVDAARRASHRRHPSLDAPGRGRDGDQGATLMDRVATTDRVDRQAIGNELGRHIAEAVEQLPVEQREVFLMRELQRLPFKEIAEVVGVPENTVKSRMRYALERLRGSLEEFEAYAREVG